MGITAIVVTYIMVWWVVFFMVAPFGIKRQENPEIGHDTGAPTNPMLPKKILITSLISAALTFVVWIILTFHLITLDVPKF